MFPDCPVFDSACDALDDKALAWDLRRRPVPSRPHGAAAVLDSETVIVADCEPGIFRGLVRETGAEEVAEAMHARDLDRAAQPPVIQVTVTTPPDGIPKAEMVTLVQRAVDDFTGPPPVLPSIPPSGPGRRGRVLVASRRRSRRDRGVPPPPEVPVSEDDMPTQVLPAVRDDGFAHVEEVYLP